MACEKQTKRNEGCTVNLFGVFMPHKKTYLESGF